MGSFSAFHWVVVALVILVLFGRGKISETMGDFGKGIRSFKNGLSEVEDSAVLGADKRPRSDVLPDQA
jgi:sec-independent protein translocase protein TatA